MANPRIQILTDEAIISYSQDKVLTEWQDINLRVLTRIEPYPNGVYDQDIFGSIFSDRCNCGNIRTPGIRCPRCGSMVLDETESFKRFARIELPVFYSTKYKLEKLVKFIKNNFNVSLEVTKPQFQGLRWSDSKCLDILQWRLEDKETGKLVLTDDINDFMKCSYEGLLDIIRNNYPELLEEYRAYINQYILVIPMALRAPSIRMEGNNRVLEDHQTTVIYKSIIYCVYGYYKEVFQYFKDEISKAYFRGSLRRLVANSMDMLSKLMQASKANLARYMQSNRMANSGRCTVVPSPSLKADEVEIPIHLMYEACRSEFIKYIQEKKDISAKEAELIYKTQSDLQEIQDLFKQYIEGEPGKPETAKYIIINRAPSLYELSMFSCKVKLTYDYVMKIPHVLCQPTNGDFDGDTYSFYSIPKEMNQMINETLGARNRIMYKKNHKPLFTPTGEMVEGLIKASKVKIVDSLEVFDSIEEAKKFRKENPDFKFQTLCEINGKRTTLGRAILTELFDKDINAFLGDYNTNLNGKTITILYEQLRDKEDRLERIQKLQEFALQVVTLSGSSSVKISDLYIGIDDSYLKKIRAVENDPNLSDQAKEIKIRDIFAEYQAHMLQNIPEEVKSIIDETSKAKSSELRDMAIQQLNVGPDKKVTVGESSLSMGMNPVDYTRHAIEQRALQDIKQQGVPQGGYVTRQFIYLASEYYFKSGEDLNNKGILIPRSKAEGRTTVDGKILPKSDSDEEVLVRSLITSTLPVGEITHDMLPNMFEYHEGAKVGMSLVSSFTENLTQSGLALKHGGHLFELFPDVSPKILAPEDGTYSEDEFFITLTSDSRKVYKWPKPNAWVKNYVNLEDHYKKGELLGRMFVTLTPTYILDSIIKLCSAKSTTSKKRFANNKKTVSECFALSDGEIKYTQRAGEIIVTINGEEYDYNPDSQYLYPDGTRVKKFTRICSGVLDMKSMVNKVTDYVELFYLFRKQLYELRPDISHELVEFIYVLLVKNNEEGLEMKSVTQNIYGSDSFYKSLAFGDARKSFQKIDYQGMDFVADPITSVILSMIMQNEIK